MLKRQQLIDGFTQRLKQQLNEKGHGSKTNTAGVKAAPIAKAIGCSQQMARKYTMGQAMPDYNSALKLAGWLEVEPSWLIFGANPTINNDKLIIEKELLTNILRKSLTLILNNHNPQQLESFLSFQLLLINDISKIKTDKNTTLKIIDTIIGGARSAGSFIRDAEYKDIQNAA